MRILFVIVGAALSIVLIEVFRSWPWRSTVSERKSMSIERVYENMGHCLDCGEGYVGPLRLSRLTRYFGKRRGRHICIHADQVALDQVDLNHDVTLVDGDSPEEIQLMRACDSLEEARSSIKTSCRVHRVTDRTLCSTADRRKA